MLRNPQFWLLNRTMEDLAEINRNVDVEAVTPATLLAWAKEANSLARVFGRLMKHLERPTDNEWRRLARRTRAKSQAILDHKLMQLVVAVTDEQSVREARTRNVESMADWLVRHVEDDYDNFERALRDPILGPNKGADAAHAIMRYVKAFELETSDLPSVFSLARRKDTAIFLLAMARGHTVRVLQEQYGVQHLLAFVDEADFATMLTISENEGLMASGTEEMDYSLTDMAAAAAGFGRQIVPALGHALARIPADIKHLLKAETWARFYKFVTEKVPRFAADEDFRGRVGKALGAASAQVIAQLREMSPYDFGKKLADFMAPLLLDLIITALSAGALQSLKIKYVTKFGKFQSEVDNIVDEVMGAFAWKMVELGIKARGADKFLGAMEQVAAVRKRIGRTIDAIGGGLESVRFGTQTARFGRENAAQRRAVRALEQIDLELAELSGRWASNQIDKAEFASELAQLERRAEVAERRIFPYGRLADDAAGGGAVVRRRSQLEPGEHASLANQMADGVGDQPYSQLPQRVKRAEAEFVEKARVRVEPFEGPNGQVYDEVVDLPNGHKYRRKEGHKAWCRFTGKPDCNISTSPEGVGDVIGGPSGAIPDGLTVAAPNVSEVVPKHLGPHVTEEIPGLFEAMDVDLKRPGKYNFWKDGLTSQQIVEQGWLLRYRFNRNKDRWELILTDHQGARLWIAVRWTPSRDCLNSWRLSWKGEWNDAYPRAEQEEYL